jgi:hypothetical protein
MSVTPASGERVHASLTDGTTVCVRPARPDDQKAALRLYSEMPDASLRLRLFSVRRHSGEQAAARVARPEDSGYRAPVAERGGRIIGIAEYQIDAGKILSCCCDCAGWRATCRSWRRRTSIRSSPGPERITALDARIRLLPRRAQDTYLRRLR